MTGHRFDVVHKDNKKPIYQHAAQHDKNFEDCYNLTAVHKIKPHHNIEYNSLTLRNSELAHQLILKSKTPFGLNHR